MSQLQLYIPHIYLYLFSLSLCHIFTRIRIIFKRYYDDCFLRTKNWNSNRQFNKRIWIMSEDSVLGIVKQLLRSRDLKCIYLLLLKCCIYPFCNVCMLDILLFLLISILNMLFFLIQVGKKNKNKIKQNFYLFLLNKHHLRYFLRT